MSDYESFPSYLLQLEKMYTNKSKDTTKLLCCIRYFNYGDITCVMCGNIKTALIVANPGLRLFLMGNVQWRCSDSISIWDYWSLSFTGLHLSVDNQPLVSWLAIKKQQHRNMIYMVLTHMLLCTPTCTHTYTHMHLFIYCNAVIL